MPAARCERAGTQAPKELGGASQGGSVDRFSGKRRRGDLGLQVQMAQNAFDDRRRVDDHGLLSGALFQMSITHFHAPSGSFRHTVTYRPAEVTRLPLESGNASRLRPAV